MVQATLPDRVTTEAPTLLEWGRMRADKIADKNDLPRYSREAENQRESVLLFGQLIPVRDWLPSLWGLPRSDDSRAVTVVSTHTSKSVLLPVYRLEVPNVGIFYMRDNFHNWKVSCILDVKIPMNTWGDFFSPTKTPMFFEGFREEWIFGPFAWNQQTFSVELPPRPEDLYAFHAMLRSTMVRLWRIPARFS